MPPTRSNSSAHAIRVSLLSGGTHPRSLPSDPRRHWPGAFQYTIPTEGLGDGTLVMDVGDIWYPVKRFITTPVKMKFENGAVVAIEGDRVGCRRRMHLPRQPVGLLYRNDGVSRSTGGAAQVVGEVVFAGSAPLQWRIFVGPAAP